MASPPEAGLLPQGILVDQTPHACPYLPDRTAVLPLRWYQRAVDPEDFDGLLALADRRVGRTLYRPTCPSCSECKGIRVPVAEFTPSKSQRKVRSRNADLTVLAGPPTLDDAHVALFNRHKMERGLGDRPISMTHYRNWLVVSCARTVETRYMLGDRLVAVGILDLGRKDASSVYFYFDPDESWRSLGVFSVLTEVAWLRQQGFRHYYLGLYVEGCDQLNYKARYFPHERREAGRWVRFERPEP